MARIAVLLDIFGTRVRKALEGVLDDVAEAGFEGVECRPLADRLNPGSLRLHLESRNLVLAGLHLEFGELDRAPAALDELAEAGGRYLVVSGAADANKGGEEDEKEENPEAAFRCAAEALNALGGQAAESGAVLCYRHRGDDFAQVGDKTGFQVLCEATDPERVKLCIDTYWVAWAGKDPAVFVHKHRKRIAIAHLTDGRPEDATDEEAPDLIELGIGSLDFPSILKMLALAQPEWLTCAQDRSTLPPAESIRRSREYLRELGC